MDPKETDKKKFEVVVRIRPQQKPDNVWVRAIDDHRLFTINHRNVDKALEYEFEHVFGEKSSQACIYETCVQPLLRYVLEGQNASVLAYGPTGSGKTHTILGDESNPGIIPRCVQDIFSLIESERNKPLVGGGCRFDVFYSYLEIYNEKVHDLLELNPADLQIRQNQDQNIFVVGLSEKEIKSSDEFNQSFLAANRKRTTAVTKLNALSSRSHAVLLLKVIKTDMSSSPYRKLSSKIYLIDLAGSEDNRRTGNEGIRLKESGAINTSLFMLAEVVDALKKGKTVIPYRQSKLTRLLQDSLGGNSHSVMIVNVAPEGQHYLDTVSTLKLARKAKKIVNAVSTNDITEKLPGELKVVEINKKAASLTEVPASFLSPLVRNQSSLQAEVTKMKKEMESIKSIISVGPSVNDSTVSSTSRLSELSVDTTNCQSNKSSQERIPKRRALAVINVDNLFDSPFCLPPVKKRSKISSSSAVPTEALFVPKEVGVDSKLQEKHNAEKLNQLNGSLKELKKLQKIGDKKARLIYDWRMQYGPLDSISDVQMIPGFTNYKNFFKANLINLD